MGSPHRASLHGENSGAARCNKEAATVVSKTLEQPQWTRQAHEESRNSELHPAEALSPLMAHNDHSRGAGPSLHSKESWEISFGLMSPV